MNAHDLAEHPNWAHQLESIGCAGAFVFDGRAQVDVCELCLVARPDHWAPSDSQVADPREVRFIELAIDRALPKGVTRIRGGVVLDVRFETGNPIWGARFTYQRNRRVRNFDTSDVYASPSGALFALLRSARQTPKDLW